MENNTPDTVEYKELLEKEREAHLRTKIRLNARELELHMVTQSGSYKLAKKLALVKHITKKALNHAKDLSPRRIKLNKSNNRYVKSVYLSQEFNKEFLTPATTNIAVVLHLYYPDLLGYFYDRMKSLGNIKYDLFVTLPDTKKEATELIKSRFPEARIVVVPNSGRDVQPFIEVARKLHEQGYEKVLKIHSKKSPHRNDGDEWRDSIVKNLIPDEKHLLDILKKLDSPNVALIGPTDEYVSFLVNYHSTAHHTKKLIAKNYGEKLARELESIADEYGFFAGTMFWARLDALMPIIANVQLADFEPELGQEDSTMAHALERLFCVIPELDHQKIYGCSRDGLKELSYHTVNIPEWSDFAINN